MTEAHDVEFDLEPRHCASCGRKLPPHWPAEWSICGKCHHARQQYKREVRDKVVSGAYLLWLALIVLGILVSVGAGLAALAGLL